MGHSEYRRIGFVLLIIIFSLLATSSVAFSSADEAIVKIQKAYEGIKDVSGKFVQKSYIKDLKQTETFKGQFFIKRPMKLRWNYTGEQAQEVLISNDEIIIYQKSEKQVFRSPFDRDTYGQAPIALLSGFGNITKEFSVSEKQGRLLLKPKKPMGGVISIEIEPSDGEFPIRSFTINDAYANRIEMVLKEVRINTGLKDAFFELSLPKGVTTYQHTP